MMSRRRSKLAVLRPHLNERKWRLPLGAEAEAIGRGGISLVARLSGSSRATVQTANTVHTIDHRLHWSIWRRRHQANASTTAAVASATINIYITNPGCRIR
jgi:hypothetical protein